MEKIKMYKIRWKGKISYYEHGVMNVINSIVDTCMECCEGDIHTSSSVSGEPVSKEVKVNIVTLGKEKADRMAEWLKDMAGMEMEVKKIEISPPSLSKIKNVSGESGERTLSNRADL